MKVLLISDLTGGPGGVYTYLRQVERFANHSTDIRIALDLSTKQLVSEHYLFCNTQFLPLSLRYHDEELILESVNNAIKDFSPDIVHVVNGSVKSNLIIREYLIAYSIPFVVTEQFIDESFNAEPNVLKRLYDVNKKTPSVIYVSSGNAAIAQEKFKFEVNSRIIFNGILPIKEKKSQYSHRPRRVFTTGRYVEQKGIDILIKAISKIKNHFVELYVIGNGEKKSEYQTLAKRLFKSNHNLILTDWQNSMNYTSFYDTFDLYVSASRQEGFSFGLLEAASSGFPIICSDCSGSAELVQLCDCGQLFENGNEEHLYWSISSFFENAQILNNKAILNTQNVDQFFDIRLLIRDLQNTYSELLS